MTFKNDFPLRIKIIGIYSFLFITNIIVWLWAFYSLHTYPFLFSTAVLAYTFGLRHAVDADHIAAIDNVTRKLMQEGQRPATVGLFFSLGHSSVVIIGSVCIALATTKLMHSNLTGWHEIADIACTFISALFLLIIAIVNLIIFFPLFQIFKRIREGKHYHEEDIDTLIRNGGFLARQFRFLFKVITKSWHMFPLGFLFGIGFDTATEIALLGIAASQVLNGQSIESILIFPALFTAGMTLIDTTDGIIMLGAYGWAFMKPIRKLYYNLTITFVSVVVAFFVGGVEALGLIANQIKSTGHFWNLIRNLNYHFNLLGYVIIFIFLASWLIPVIIFKYMNLEKLES